MVCITPFRGWFGGVCTRVGSTYVWKWAPRAPDPGPNLYTKPNPYSLTLTLNVTLIL